MEDTYKKLEESKQYIRESNEFLYISMAWWWDDYVGRELFKEVEKAHKRNIDIRVEMRPDPKNQQIERKLSQLNIKVTEIVEFHAKAICNEKSLLIMNGNYFEKDMLRNINFSAVEKDQEKINDHKKEFLERSFNKTIQFDGPELYTQKSKLIKEKNICDLLKWEKLNPLQSKVCRHVLYGDENLLVIAPTASGKTLIGELALYRSILLEGKRAVWIVPSRALADEITQSLYRVRSPEIRPLKCLGNDEVSNSSLRDNNIWICTIEKFESLLRKKSIDGITYEIESVIVDEIHLLGDQGRGQILESIIARYKDRINTKRIVGLSATLENAEEFSGWLNARLLKSKWVPNTVHKEVITFEATENESPKYITKKKNEILTKIIRSIKNDKNKSGPIIIFCGSKNKCRNRAFHITSGKDNAESSYDFKATFNEEDFVYLKDQRVGIHYSNFQFANEFKNLYLKKEIDVLFATTGLAQGVNLPAKHVIILDTILGKDSNLDLNQAEQMLGRAGRTHDSEGWGYLVCPSYEYNKWKDDIGVKTSNVNSVIDKHLPDVLLAEFFLENINCERDAFDFYKRSFRTYQSKKDETTILKEVSNSIDFLLSNDFLERRKDDDRLIPTEVGKASIQFMVDTNIAVSLINSCSKIVFPNSYKEAEKQLIKILADALPKATIYDIDYDLEKYITEVLNNIGISIKEDQAIDYISLFAIHLALNDPEEISKISAKNKELRSFFQLLLEDQCPRYFGWLSRIGKYTRSPWVVFCTFDLSKRLKWHKLSPNNYKGSSKLISFLEQLINPEEVNNELPKTWQAAINKRFTSPTKLDRETKELSCSKNADAIQRRLSSLIRKSDVKLNYDDKIKQIRISGLPTDTRTVFAEVFKPNSVKGLITYITEGREFLISVPFGSNPTNTYKILISIETRTDRDLLAFEKSITSTDNKNQAEAFYQNIITKITDLPDIQKISKKKGLLGKIKKKLHIGDFDESELKEWVLAKKQYFVELVDLLNQDYVSPVDKCMNINTEINKIIRLKPSLDNDDEFSFRSMTSVLKSGVATKFERELCKLCLASNAGLNFGVIMGSGRGAFYSVCEINNKWFAFENISHIIPIPVYPNPLGSSRIELIRKNSKNFEYENADINWVEEFQEFN